MKIRNVKTKDHTEPFCSRECMCIGFIKGWEGQ